MSKARNKFFFFTLFLLLLFCLSFAQNTSTSFQHLSIDNGLSSNHINCILQDNTGYIWIGTNDGLNKFNGYLIKTFRNVEGDSLSLASNFITCGFKDSKNRLWFGGDFLCMGYPDEGKFTNFKYTDGDTTSISAQYVNEIVEDEGGRVWMATRNGLCVFNESTKTFTRFLQDTLGNKGNAFERNFITDLAADKHGALWVATLHGLYRFSIESKEFFSYSLNKYSTPLANIEINSLCLDKSGNLWIAASDSGLFLFDGKEGSIEKINYLRYGNNLVSKVVHNVFCDKAGKIWLATGFNGISVYNPETREWKKYLHDIFDNRSLVDDKTQLIFEDKSGLVWIGTHRGGVDRIQPYPDKFNSYLLQPGRPSSLCNNDITIGLEDNKGNLWLGAKEGMMYFDRATNSFNCFKHEALNANSLSSNTIYAITKDPDNNLWIGTDKGLNYFNVKTKKWKHYFHDNRDKNALPGVEVFDCYVKKDGTILVGTNGSICSFNPTKETFTTRFNNENISRLRGNNYITTFEHSDGTVWLSTSSTGILHVTDSFQLLHSFHESGGFNASVAHLFVEDSMKNVWMATNKGLYRWNYSTADFTVFNSAVWGLNGDIKSVVIEKENTLWISTAEGIAQIVFKNEKEIASVKKFDVSDGLQGNAFNNCAGMKLKSGELFFGGINGFNLFNPAAIIYNKYIPEVEIIGFKVFDKEFAFQRGIDSTVQITLNYDQNFFTFEMGAMSYDHPEKNQFAYQLEGVDKEMNYSKTNRFASYTNISPGSYVLHIIASNNDGVWNTTGTKITITIVPPFWKTNLFIALVAVCLVLIIGILYQRRIKKIKRKEQARNEINKQIAEARLSALRAQMNPHFIFNSLNSIQQFISESEKEEALKYLSRFSKLIRLVLQNAERNTNSIADELSMLSFYLELESLRFSGKFSYSFNVDETIDRETTQIPAMLLQPYIENAVNHGLLNKETNGHLQISLLKKGNYLYCIIEDNGIGRDAAAVIKNRKMIHHESLGMKVTAERMQMMESIANKKVKITILDLKDKNLHPIGTKVEIEIAID